MPDRKIPNVTTVLSHGLLHYSCEWCLLFNYELTENKDSSLMFTKTCQMNKELIERTHEYVNGTIHPYSTNLASRSPCIGSPGTTLPGALTMCPPSWSPAMWHRAVRWFFR